MEKVFIPEGVKISFGLFDLIEHYCSVVNFSEILRLKIDGVKPFADIYRVLNFTHSP